jgi:hypothetical protein
MTDVTGFGMIGHLREVAKGSGVSMRLFPSKVPLREAALECMRRGDVPGGLKANRNFAEGCVEYAEDVPEGREDVALQSIDGRRIADLRGGGGCFADIGFAPGRGGGGGSALEKQSPLIRVQQNKSLSSRQEPQVLRLGYAIIQRIFAQNDSSATGRIAGHKISGRPFGRPICVAQQRSIEPGPSQRQ